MVQMPALNTPQFEWVKSRLPNRAQPVPPIYQPEVAADAIVHAASHDRDELWVGRSTAKAIIGNRIIPRRLDRMLAKSGFDSQMTDEPERPDRRYNLWNPVDDDNDYGAHGRFDDRARDRSYLLWATVHQKSLVAAGISLAVFAAVALYRQVKSS